MPTHSSPEPPTTNPGEPLDQRRAGVRVGVGELAAANDAYITNQGGTLTVAAPGVFANDSNPERRAAHCGARFRAGARHVSLNADGSFTYIRQPDFSGADGLERDLPDAVRVASCLTRRR